MSFAGLYLISWIFQWHASVIQIWWEIQSVPLPVCRLISRHIPADPAWTIAMAMLLHAINQAALVKSTDNSGNSCNMRASGCNHCRHYQKFAFFEGRNSGAKSCVEEIMKNTGQLRTSIQITPKGLRLVMSICGIIGIRYTMKTWSVLMRMSLHI